MSRGSGTLGESPNGDIAPTITIYQNPDHIAGILQQLYKEPLLTDESRERGSDSASGEKVENKGRGGIKGSAQVPVVGELGADLTGDRTRIRDNSLSSNAKTVQNFKYSQAYYLLLVREELRRRGLLKLVQNSEDASGLTSGDWIEFQATFRPSALHALLDILTPELIAAIVDRRARGAEVDRFSEFETPERWKVFYEGVSAKAKVHADIARAIAQAVRVDFRVEKTREFYGTVDENVTAITICDNPHFSVQDEDRVLDGVFHVLAKVTSGVEFDVPILSRNKLLDRISPNLVDELFSFLREQADSQVTSLELGGEQRGFERMFDLALPSRIAGASFKVVPVAIFS